jgi:hypothetical protein
MRSCIMLLHVAVLLTAALACSSEDTWEINLPLVEQTIGCAPINELVLTIQDPTGAPMILDQPAWACQAMVDYVYCEADTGVVWEGESVMYRLRVNQKEATLSLDPFCVYEF